MSCRSVLTIQPALLLRSPATSHASRRSGPQYRGLHSSTFQLNLGALYGIGGARKDCVARIKGVLWGMWGVKGVSLCQTRLKFSWEVNECKPLPQYTPDSAVFRRCNAGYQGRRHPPMSQLHRLFARGLLVPVYPRTIAACPKP